jgi:hypothetical protein
MVYEMEQVSCTSSEISLDGITDSMILLRNRMVKVLLMLLKSGNVVHKRKPTARV